MTKVELEMVLKGRDDASASVRSVENSFLGLGRTAEDLSKKFSGINIVKSLLGGLGLGSGIQIANLITEQITKPYQEAADAAERLVAATARQAQLLRSELFARPLSTDQQRRVLEREANQARANLEAEKGKYLLFDSFQLEAATPEGRKVMLESQSKLSDKQSAELDRLKGIFESASTALNNFNERIRQEEIDTKLRDFFREVEVNAGKTAEAVDSKLTEFFDGVEDRSAKQVQKVDDLLGDFFREVEYASAERTARVDDALTTFFGDVERGAEKAAEAVDDALGTFFGAMDRGGDSALDRSRAGARRAGTGGGFREGAEIGVNETIAGIGTNAEIAARGVQSTLGNTVYGISDGLRDAIAGFKSLKEAGADIWLNFKLSALQAFTDMVTQYGVKKAAMFAVDVLFAGKGLALQAAAAAKSLAAWIPSAIAASISSWGTAAAIGAAAVAAVLVGANNFGGGGGSPAASFQSAGAVAPTMGAQAVSASFSAGSDAGSFDAGGRPIILVDSRREANRVNRNSAAEGDVMEIVQRNRDAIAS
jgi:hypothetical protein